MVSFDGLTKHFLTMLVDYFSIIYTMTNDDFGSDKTGRKKTKIEKTAVVL